MDNQNTATRVVYDWPKALELYTGFCNENKLDVKLPYPEPANEDEMNTNAFKMVKDIKLVENKGEICNPLDTDQWKHYPWFKPNKSGSGLAYYVYVGWLTYASVAARLCSLDSDNVEPAANKYQPIYDILQS